MQPAGPSGPPRDLPEVPLSAALIAVVSGARRRAVRDGDRQLDTAHLLHSLLESDAAVREAIGRPAQVARLLGYLVQRSIGYGLQWQSGVEDSGAVPVVRESLAVPVVRESPAWSPAVAMAMEAALARAERRGDARASGVDLLAALAADPECRAVEVLRRAGVEPEALVARLGGATDAG